MKTALVTGGNRGLGLETCRQLALQGYAVLLAARDRAEGEKAARSLGERVRFVPLDVSDPASVERLARALEQEPVLDALVNNAGASLKGFDAAVAASTIDVNYRGAVRVTDALLGRLAPSANIVMVSSGMGELSHVSPELARRFQDPALDRAALDALVDEFIEAVRSGGDLGGWPRNAYSVSKVAMNAFVRILARELSGTAQRVNAVCPGWVQTRMGGSSASRTVERGASGIVWAATLGAGDPSGGFFETASPSSGSGRLMNYLALALSAGWMMGVLGCGGSDKSAASQGGATGSGASSSGGSQSGGAGGVSSGGAAAGGISAGGASTAGSTAAGGSPPAGACAVTSERVRITEVDVGATVDADEDEAALHPLVISAIPAGGSRLGWMGSDGQVHVTELDADDQPTGASLALMAHDFSDLYADDSGGVLLLTRDAEGGGTLNCGAPSNLCGVPPDPPIACFDMYMVRFDGASESWATKLTDSSASLPPYSTAPDGPRVYMIWWYAHHGRIASDGANYAGYFGSAVSVSQNGCINIHQGDRMKVVDAGGSLQTEGFDWGCSHSGYERIVWDPAAAKFVTVCKTDNNNRIAFAPGIDTIYPVDLAYSNLGNLVLATGGGYWLTASNARAGEPAGADGLADVHLLHFSDATADQDIVLASDAEKNDRAPHLASYGNDRLLAAWETSSQPGDLRASDTARALFVQALDRTDGTLEGDALQVDVRGNRYQDFVAFPDGSVAFAAPGSQSSTIKILRILPCAAQ